MPTLAVIPGRIIPRTGHPLTEPLRHEEDVLSASFSPDGKRVVTASFDNTARVWDIAPSSNIPVPDWLAPLAEAVGGRRLNDQTICEAVDPKLCIQLRERFRNATENDPYTMIARWFFSDPSTRPITPYSQLQP